MALLLKFVIHSLLLAGLFFAAGPIPWDELQFSAFASIYLVFLAKIAFPRVTAKAPPSAFAGSKLLKRYVSVGAVVGLIVPVSRIVINFFRQGRSESSALPHTTLLLLQIASEGIAAGSASFPIRAFIPIAYNSRRLFTIWDWIGSETGDRWIAIANMAFWSFNLFGFLLPCFLPIALRRHYEQVLKKKQEP